MTDVAEEDDLAFCESCERRMPWDEAHMHVDVWLCSTCDAEWRAAFDACAHAWEPHIGDWEEGRFCTRCAAFIEDSAAIHVFPLICDGWVEVAGDAA